MADDDISTDPERLARLADELQKAAPANLVLQPTTSMALIGALQLALRHPEFPPSSEAIVHEVVETLAHAIGPEAEQLVAEGW